MTGGPKSDRTASSQELKQHYLLAASKPPRVLAHQIDSPARTDAKIPDRDVFLVDLPALFTQGALLCGVV
jgi:hypothetical protein